MARIEGNKKAEKFYDKLMENETSNARIEEKERTKKSIINEEPHFVSLNLNQNFIFILIEKNRNFIS